MHSPSVVRENTILKQNVTLCQLVFAIFPAIIITSVFILCCYGFLWQISANVVISAVVFLFALQFCVTILQRTTLNILKIIHFPIGVIVASFYGIVISKIETKFASHIVLNLNLVHVLFIMILFIGLAFIDETKIYQKALKRLTC